MQLDKNEHPNLLVANANSCLRIQFSTPRPNNGTVLSNIHPWSLKNIKLPDDQLIIGRTYYIRDPVVISEIKKLPPECKNANIQPMFSQLIQSLSEPVRAESVKFLEEICENVYVLDVEKLNLFNLTTPPNTVFDFFTKKEKTEYNIFATRTGLEFLSPDKNEFLKDLLESNKKIQILYRYRETKQLKDLLEFQNKAGIHLPVVTPYDMNNFEIEKLLKGYDDANYNRISEASRKIIDQPRHPKPEKKKINCNDDDVD